MNPVINPHERIEQLMCEVEDLDSELRLAISARDYANDMLDKERARLAQLEGALREAAWIICDHGQCEAVEWSLRRGNWEDKYAAKASNPGDGK